MESDELKLSLASSLMVLHWDNGCKHCPLIDKCKKADTEANVECQDIWLQWINEVAAEC